MRAKKRRRPPEFALEVAFEQQVRRMPAARQAEFLAWLRRWRQQPDRVFWEITPTGERRRV
jgi:hypothetical protein